MIRIYLPDDQLHRLQDTFPTTSDRRLRDRIQIILRAHRARPHAQIATDLGISRPTVPRWLNAYTERGLDGLRPGKAKGAAPTRRTHFKTCIIQKLGERADPLAFAFGRILDDPDVL